MVEKVRYPVKSEAIREIQEEIVKSRVSWKRIEMVKPVYISTKYYEFIKGVRASKRSFN